MTEKNLLLSALKRSGITAEIESVSLAETNSCPAFRGLNVSQKVQVKTIDSDGRTIVEPYHWHLGWIGWVVWLAWLVYCESMGPELLLV